MFDNLNKKNWGENQTQNHGVSIATFAFKGLLILSSAGPFSAVLSPQLCPWVVLWLATNQVWQPVQMVSRLTGRYHENVTVPTTTLVNTTEHHSVWQHRVPHRERHSRQPCPHSAGFSTSRCAKCTSSSTVPCFYWCVPANDTCLTAASQCLLPSCCLVIHPAGSSRISRPSAGDQRHQRGACGESLTLWHLASRTLIVIQRLSFDKSNQHKPHTWNLMNSHTLLGILSSRVPGQGQSSDLSRNSGSVSYQRPKPPLTIFVCCGGPAACSIVVPSPNFENSISGRQAGLSAVDGGNGGGIAEERGGAHCRQWLFDWRAASPRGAGQLWPRVGKPRRVLITTCVIVGLVSLSTYFLTKNITAITNKLVKCAFLFQKISICHYTRKVYDNIFKIWIYWPCLNYIVLQRLLWPWNPA